MCTVLPPPGVNPTAVNKYIILYHINTVTKSTEFVCWFVACRPASSHYNSICLCETDTTALSLNFPSSVQYRLVLWKSVPTRDWLVCLYQ